MNWETDYQSGFIGRSPHGACFVGGRWNGRNLSSFGNEAKRLWGDGSGETCERS